jgi:septal ring factor EnvC (AmiA/AmiB activator)
MHLGQRLLGLVVIAAFAWVGSAQAQEPSTASLQERLRSQLASLEKIQKELERRSAQVKSSRSKERSILLEIEAADRQLEILRTELELASRQVKTHQARLKALEEEVSSLEERLERQQGDLARHLRRIYRDRSMELVEILLTAPTLTAAKERALALERLASLEERQLDRYHSTLETLKKRRHELAKTQARLLRARAQVKLQTENLKRKIKAKKALLAAIRSKRRLQEKALEEMEASAQELQRLLEGSKAPAATDRPQASAALASLAPSPFSLLKGQLPWPLDGGPFKLIKPPSRLYQGLLIEAPEGTPIEAVADGTVVFADRFRGYGYLCIIDHGGGYHTLYAHAMELAVRVGQRVAAGELIGRVGSSGAAETPRLYFEIRQRGQPVDARPWLQARATKP